MRPHVPSGTVMKALTGCFRCNLGDLFSTNPGGEPLLQQEVYPLMTTALGNLPALSGVFYYERGRSPRLSSRYHSPSPEVLVSP